jgi:hypothetical protein
LAAAHRTEPLDLDSETQISDFDLQFHAAHANLNACPHELNLRSNRGLEWPTR